MPPLHVRHHEPGSEVQAAGVFRITGAGPLTFQGRRVLAVFADLMVTKEWLADEIEAMRYPYRSVEIFKPDGPPKINGLALLDHEAPYLELPMLFASSVDDQRREPGAVAPATISLNYKREADAPLLGSAFCGTRAALLFKFGDDNMAEETTTIDDTTETVEAPANFEGDKDDAEKMDDGPSMDVDAICKAIASGDISVADMDKILTAIQSQSTEQVEDEPATAPAPGAEMMSDNTEQALNFARLEARNVALEARLDERDKADARREAVAGAMKRLEGKPLGALDALESKLLSFHEKCGGNAEVFQEFVDTMAKTSAPLPSQTGGANFQDHPNVPKVAMAYQKRGEEAVALASQFAREYEQFGGRMRASVEAYVQTNMAAKGIELPTD